MSLELYNEECDYLTARLGEAEQKNEDLLNLLKEEHKAWNEADLRAIKAEARVRELERKIKEFTKSCQ